VRSGTGEELISTLVIECAQSYWLACRTDQRGDGVDANWMKYACASLINSHPLDAQRSTTGGKRFCVTRGTGTKVVRRAHAGAAPQAGGVAL
jgi:hypothetical protein